MNKAVNPKMNIQSSPAKRRKRVSLNQKKERIGWLFILPFVIGFIAIYVPVIFESIYYSFVKSQSVAGAGNIYIQVGFENYRYALFTDPDFFQLLLSNLSELALNVPAIVIFSLFLAILLNQKMIGRAAFRAIFFIPVITSTGIIETINIQASLVENMQNLQQLEGGTTGITQSATEQILQVADISRLFNNMFIGRELIEPVVGLVNQVYSLVDRTGVQMLIFLAGLQSISPSIYESCYMEGASEWETFWKITIPMISPMILVNLIYTIIDSFTRQSNSVMNFIADTISGKKGPDGYTHGTAMAWIYFLFIIIIVALIGAIFSTAYVFYQRREK
ncbi:MAG: sugar ABC transporter permease [Eubacteriales bacterium]|nr:sugar ABC transporter permease [Eubacteriales bacterium]MDD4475432.1 sugar ABC transporter permease [Eubacteriales bacterium]